MASVHINKRKQMSTTVTTALIITQLARHHTTAMDKRKGGTRKRGSSSMQTGEGEARRRGSDTASSSSTESRGARSGDSQSHSAAEDMPRSVRGAPAHLKAAIRKRQNSEAARRSRERRKEVYRALFDKFQEHTRQIAALEARVDSLLHVIETAGIAVPGSLAQEVHRAAASSGGAGGAGSSSAGGQQQRMSAVARADIAASVGNIAARSDCFRPGSPDDDELFEMIMKMLDEANDPKYNV